LIHLNTHTSSINLLITYRKSNRAVPYSDATRKGKKSALVVLVLPSGSSSSAPPATSSRGKRAQKREREEDTVPERAAKKARYAAPATTCTASPTDILAVAAARTSRPLFTLALAAGAESFYWPLDVLASVTVAEVSTPLYTLAAVASTMRGGNYRLHI
jgi:hypothetical protein